MIIEAVLSLTHCSVISSVKMPSSTTWCWTRFSVSANECVTKSLLPILFRSGSGIVFSAMVNVFDSEANNYCLYLLPPNFPFSNSLCGRRDGRNEHWLSALQQIQNRPLNVSMLILSCLSHRRKDRERTISAIVQKDGNLCWAGIPECHAN